jgi:hypothetical protein
MKSVKVYLSKSDTHPVKGLLQFGEAPEKLIRIVGLKGSRGNNLIYCSHMTEELEDVIDENGYEVYETDDVIKCDGKGSSDNVIVIGISKNIRKSSIPTEYLSLIIDLVEAAMGEPISDDDENDEVDDDNSSYNDEI